MALSDAYTTVGSADVEIEIERSRFLCRLRRADTETAARSTVAEARTEHRQANHHCSAFIIGPGRDLRRSNDDGEPAGTAGRPMLEVLAQHELSDVVAVVTRYFGGIKLGTGGLARAYSDAVGRAVEAAPRVRRRRMRECVVTLSHTEAGRAENVLRGDRLDVRDVVYGDSVALHLVLPEDRLGDLRRRLGALHIADDRLRLGALGWHDVGEPGDPSGG